MAFALDKAQIVALFVTSVFYGYVEHYPVPSPIKSEPLRRIFSVTFFGCLRVLLWSSADERFKSWDKIKFPMLIPAVLMFIFGSLDISFALRQNINAFILSGGHAIEKFEETTSWLIYMKMVDYVAQTCIGDGILIYRCWVIYGRKWPVVLFPVLMWLACTGCGIVTCYMEASLATNPKVLNAKNIIPFITSMLTLTLAINLTSTSLIVYRIWSVQQATSHRPNEKTRMSRVIRILIESGLIYTVTVVILFVVYLLSSNAQFPVSDAVVQIIGITFNLIIIRVQEGKTPQTIINPTVESHFRSHRGSSRFHNIQVHTTVSTYHDSDLISTPSVAIARPLESKAPIV